MVTNSIRLSAGGDRRAQERDTRNSQDIAIWCGLFQDLCRERGVRVTAQRLAVYRALAESTAHPSAESIYEKLKAGGFSLSPATVYRILEFLEHEGLVRRVSTTEGAGRFDANLKRHLHLACRICGSMMDYEQELPPELKLPESGTGGFMPEAFDIRIIGLCQQCRHVPPPRKRVAAR
jgi:Fur family peroxide stress response transcriptional regulator